MERRPNTASQQTKQALAAAGITLVAGAKGGSAERADGTEAHRKYHHP